MSFDAVSVDVSAFQDISGKCKKFQRKTKNNEKSRNLRKLYIYTKAEGTNLRLDKL